MTARRGGRRTFCFLAYLVVLEEEDEELRNILVRHRVSQVFLSLTSKKMSFSNLEKVDFVSPQKNG